MEHITQTTLLLNAYLLTNLSLRVATAPRRRRKLQTFLDTAQQFQKHLH